MANPWHGPSPPSKLQTFYHRFYTSFYQKHGRLPTLEEAQAPFMPSAETLASYEGKVLIITDFIHGNFKYGLQGRNLLDKDFHEFLVREKPELTLQFWDDRSNNSFSLPYYRADPWYRIAQRVVADPVLIWKELQEPLDRQWTELVWEEYWLDDEDEYKELLLDFENYKMDLEQHPFGSLFPPSNTII